MAEAGFHWVTDQRLDLDHVAALGGFRHIDEGTCVHGRSSRHAASVTTTSCVSDQHVPSDISAIAVSFCVVASRMQVATCALPARGPSCTEITFGCGFFSLNTWIALTKSSFVIGESTETVIGTTLPFSTSGGRSRVTLPVRIGASPNVCRIAACIWFGAGAGAWAFAAAGNAAPITATLPAFKTSRRVALIVCFPCA